MPETILTSLPLPDLLNHLREIVRQELASAAPMETPKQTDLLSRKQAAERLNITTKTLNSWIKCGKIKANRAGRRVLIRSVDLEAALKPIKL